MFYCLPPQVIPASFLFSSLGVNGKADLNSTHSGGKQTLIMSFS